MESKDFHLLKIKLKMAKIKNYVQKQLSDCIELAKDQIGEIPTPFTLLSDTKYRLYINYISNLKKQLNNSDLTYLDVIKVTREFKVKTYYAESNLEYSLYNKADNGARELVISNLKLLRQAINQAKHSKLSY